MRRMPSRQVHLDFHTGPIAGIGSHFDKKQFQEALKLGHINSMTVFGKCHHGYHYFPTQVGTLHPGLEPGRDLAGEMMDACHEIGVFAPLYLTLGWSALDAEQHPEWVARDKNGAKMGNNFDFLATPDTPKPECSWVHLCSAGGYRDYLYAMTREACERYERLDGIFFDIVFVYDVCYCDACVKGMREMGLDPANEADAKQYYAIQKKITLEGLNAIIKETHPDATVFYNSGGAEMHMPQWHDYNTHFEMEDLPTVWGGYDKLPIRARYFSRKGKDYLGMTGKFHRAWGEFGGYKTPEALTYECAAMLASGARISTGDQMHPDGHMDLETYKHIGQAYSYVEQIEDYCFDTTETARLGVMVGTNPMANEAVSKILLDCQIDFDIVHGPEDLDRFDTILLPDNYRLDEAFGAAFTAYAKKGGKILMLGGSGLKTTEDTFAFDVPFTYEGQSAYDKDFFKIAEDPAEKSGADKDHIPTSPILCYSSAHQVKAEGMVLAQIVDPYFSRTYGQYCSHYNTPYSTEEEAVSAYPAAVRCGNIIYVAHELATLYRTYGNVFHRRYFKWLLTQLYKNEAVHVEMPAQGRIHFVKREQDSMYVLHLLYATPIQRGQVAVLEDFQTITDIPVAIDVPETIRSIKLVPQQEELPFSVEDGLVRFTLPKLKMHQMLVLEY